MTTGSLISHLSTCSQMTKWNVRSASYSTAWRSIRAATVLDRGSFRQPRGQAEDRARVLRGLEQSRNELALEQPEHTRAGFHGLDRPLVLPRAHAP